LSVNTQWRVRWIRHFRGGDLDRTSQLHHSPRAPVLLGRRWILGGGRRAGHREPRKAAPCSVGPPYGFHR